MIALARASREAGRAPYGSLLAGSDGRVLAEDHNTVLADRDIAAHRWTARELDRHSGGNHDVHELPAVSGVHRRHRPNGLGRVVYAPSARQFAERYPDSRAPSVPQEGPALHEEAVAVLDGYER